MAEYPNRCQHIKVNGVQCGSPALRRNRFCFFHKRFHDERIRLSADRAPPRRRHLYSARSRRRQLHSNGHHANHASHPHRTDRTQNRQPSSLRAANRQLQPAQHPLRAAHASSRFSTRATPPTSPWTATPGTTKISTKRKKRKPSPTKSKPPSRKPRNMQPLAARLEAEQRIKARELAQKREQDREALRKWSDAHPDQDEPYIDEHGMRRAPAQKATRQHNPGTSPRRCCQSGSPVCLRGETADETLNLSAAE